MINKDTFPLIKDQAVKLHARAGILDHHAHTNRVTHTVASIIRCVLSVSELCRYTQSDKNYAKLLKRTFDRAYDPHGGSYEIVLYDDNTVFIRGSFHVSKLRDGLLAVPQQVELVLDNTDGK